MDQNDRKPKAINRFTQKLAASRFFTTSLVIHVILVAILGTVVVVKTRQESQAFEASVGQETGFIEEAPGTDAPTEEEFVEDQPVSEAKETTAVSQSAISSLTDATATWSTSASMDEMTIGTSLSTKSLASIGTGTGGGRPGGGGGGGGGKMGSLFGVKVEAAKLGVILDVSGSAHGVLIHAIDEIDRSFKDAEIVLYPGCGMAASSRSNEYDIKAAKPFANDYEKRAKEKEMILGQIAMWVSKNQNEERKIKSLLRSPNTYLMISEPPTKQIMGCQFAFEHLIKSGADTIYWFADFADAIDPKVAEDLAQKLKNRGIKLIAHNFGGGKVRPEAMTMVNATGGQAISKVPGKK